MKKIPTLFERTFDERGRITGILPTVKEGFEWVLRGEGDATLKIDGSCCAIIDGKFYKRYDAKKGKTPPAGAIPCQEAPDPVTGHFPHWVEVNENDPADRWFVAAYTNSTAGGGNLEDGTYEAIGVHFQGNPYGLSLDRLEKHGTVIIPVERTFEGIKQYLTDHYIEGLVFWKDGEPKCKIKRSDFGIPWGKR